MITELTNVLQKTNKCKRDVVKEANTHHRYEEFISQANVAIQNAVEVHQQYDTDPKSITAEKINEVIYALRRIVSFSEIILWEVRNKKS